MKKLSFTDFVNYYEEKGYLPIIRAYSKKKLNEKQLKTKYKEYEKKLELDHKKYIPKYQEDWIKCRSKIYKRDKNTCRLWSILTDDEKQIAKKSGYLERGLSSKKTPAHFIARSRDSKLICIEDNVYTMSLLFHNRMDSGRDPITDNFIGKELVLNLWWKRILPEEIYNKYKDKY